MSNYKYLRYNQKNKEKTSKDWYNVDQNLIEVIENYNRRELKVLREDADKYDNKF